MDGVEPVLYPILRGDFISQGKDVPLVIFSWEGGVKLGVQHLAFSTVCSDWISKKSQGIFLGSVCRLLVSTCPNLLLYTLTEIVSPF